MFRKVLIANRGAIACRIERTLRRLGVASVAVYTDADRDSLHVTGADEAVRIGEGRAQDSYLSVERILAAAKETGAEAIHPGYGFLSENAAFAEACAAAGLVFIGPEPRTLVEFGKKHTARALAEAAGVPLPPGTGLLSDVEDAAARAAGIGYPVMLKSTSGGGGIGMRVCRDEEELRGAFEAVTRLAAGNFGDGGVFLEKWIEHARHIEVQIFGNAQGEVVALGERDCSPQRRNQKVLEEAPAPGLGESLRAALAEAAVALGTRAGYRSAGTVEFLLDRDTGHFYFLEVNTRLQVEHGVTEEIFGVDLVEWMLREACGELDGLPGRVPAPRGHAVQARLYAEDPGKDFQPSSGRLDEAVFPEGLRVETWVERYVEVTPHYDPMLAKLIAHAPTREEALEKLAEGLRGLRLLGVATNRYLLQTVLAHPDYRRGGVSTGWLSGVKPVEPLVDVLRGGMQTTLQAWPGRTGLWDVGIPPSGPMDSLAFRLGNRLLGNSEGATGLEITLRGPALRFRGPAVLCLAGADFIATLNGRPLRPYEPFAVQAGQTLDIGKGAGMGLRTYLLAQGGFDAADYLGSQATFTLSRFGGHHGRALEIGDVLTLGARVEGKAPAAMPEALHPPLGSPWELAVLEGPHSTEEFFDPGYLEEFYAASWEVHFNSARTGVRLIGPRPRWSRSDGGEAGLHPSNIHDNAYAVGTVDFTGDMPILLGPDGPSLGGFVCPVTVVQADLWKLGQLRPGDTLRFRRVDLDQAQALLREQEAALAAVVTGRAAPGRRFDPPVVGNTGPAAPVLARVEEGLPFPMAVRACGDAYALVEYGPMELDLALRFRAHALMEALRAQTEVPLLELTPGIRSLQIHFDPRRTDLRAVTELAIACEKALPPPDAVKVPSRIVHLPLSWDDPQTRLAIDRYQKNVRPDAPWCPSNLEFIRRINGLESLDEVKRLVFDASYLVMGLGDVYLGAPVATPVDPRHRLVTTKYNPARTWTPENAVGIGGAYLCIYGMEGPGGYQFVGRTLQVWNSRRTGGSFRDGKPWLLRFFDQIRFYPVSSDELLALREDFPRGRFEVRIEETEFDFGAYHRFLESIAPEAETFRRRQRAAFAAERDRWREKGLAEFTAEAAEAAPPEREDWPSGCIPVHAEMAGSVWKLAASPGERVREGQPLLVAEAMKMEIPILSPAAGKVHSFRVKAGDALKAGRLVALVEADP